jgi:hypothetical protein
MMKGAAILVALVPLALPLLLVPSWLIAVGALVSAALFLTGVRWTSIPFVAAGATLALIDYTVALRLAARPPDVLTATAVGVTLVLVLEIVDFERRTGGAGIDPAVIRSQIRHWIGLVLGGAAACLGLTAGAMVFTVAVPPAGAAVVVAAGILVAFAGAVWALGRDDSTPENVEESLHEDPGHL